LLQADRPKADTAVNVHETVIELLKNVFVGRVLDVGAGEGALTAKLLQMGYEVESCDVNPVRFKLSPRLCKKVDLNERLPYDSHSFDVVACVEVIEHLHDPWFVVSEFHRVLRDGGTLIVTTPNILSVASRFLYLLDGYYPFFSSRSLFSEPSDLYSKLDRHINSIGFPELRLILSESGLRVVDLAANRLPNSLTTRLMTPYLKHRMKKLYGKDSPMCSKEIFRGEILALKAVKMS
jgi:SAM-dependent methyltransferase